MASVGFERVSRWYGAAQIVGELTFNVKDGELLVLLGPSGCGKTTTLRMVAGFVRPSTGDISIGGETVTRMPPRTRGIGMVFQDYTLFPNMTVTENVGFGLRARRLPKDEIRRRVGAMLDLIRMSEFGGRYPSELSGGQQQRVGLARALAVSPRVLLMDEPLGALDLKLRETLQAEILRVQRELGITTIMVTHDQQEAMTLAHRIVVMANGRIQQIGTPEEIYETPANAFVANFVGRVNLVEGRIVAAEAGQCTVRLAGGAVFTGRAPSPPTSGSTVKVAIRPEAFRFLGPETLSQHNCLVGRLEARRFLGSTVQLLVATAVDGEFTIEHPAEPGARASGEGPQVGDVVRIGCCADRVRIFAEPAASGG